MSARESAYRFWTKFLSTARCRQLLVFPGLAGKIDLRSASRDRGRHMKFNRLRFLVGGSATLLLVAQASGGTSSLTWLQDSPTSTPGARSYLAMTYDGASKQILLFGGLGTAGYLNDTWTFDGTTWTKVETAMAPPARANAQMAYDHRTREIVLFGGYDGRKDLGDTWLWDGRISSWTQALPTHSPKAVTGPMVFTGLRGRVEEFGGFSGNLYEGTMWEWDGSDWRQVNATMLPYARSSSAVGVNNQTKQIVLFGGLGDVNPVNTWTYDGTTWTLESPPNQLPWVYGASAVFDPGIGTVILFGGGSGGVDQDSTWSWDGNWEQLFPAQSPGGREGAGIAYDPGLGRTVVFGGQLNEVPLDDTWELIP